MGDLYLEELVLRKKTLKDKMIIVGLIAFGFYLWVGAFMWSFSLFYLLPAVVVTVVAIIVLPRLNVEWEYTYVDAELDIDKIFNRARRKRVGTYEIKKAEIIAPANSHRLDYHNNNKKMKVMDCTSLFPERQKNVYAIIIEDDKYGMVKVLFEPSQDMITDMSRRAPRTVFFD